MLRDVERVSVNDPIRLLTTDGFSGYALLDSGAGRKLERFGDILVDRPEPQALWQPRTPDRWRDVHATFAGAATATGDDDEKGRWRISRPVPELWSVTIDRSAFMATSPEVAAADGREGADVTMLCRLGNNWHLGLFPEQGPHWRWMVDGIGAVAKHGTTPRVLNLFGYTGAASLIAAHAGAEVTHVDASKKAVAWARDNQAASGLAAMPVRWIVDDARKFVARECRRGRQYDIIVVDPPKFGRGPDHEIWDLFEHLPPLLRDLSTLLAPGAASRLVLTAYAIRASSLALDGVMRDVFGPTGGSIESGELALIETDGRRMIGTSLFSRYQSQPAAR